MGDDLDEEWWLNDNEPLPEDDKTSVSEEAENSDGDSSPEIKDKGKKRKIDEVVAENEEDPTGVEDKKCEPEKKKKKRRSKAEDIAKRGIKPLTYEDFNNALHKNYEGKLSAVEWDEIQISEKNIGVCNDMTHTPNSFLREVAPKWKKLVKKSDSTKMGSPIMLILSSAAIRATELNRSIKEFKGESCKCAKLFAKHMKLGEQEKFLKKQAIHLGIGTPNRISALIENGALKLDELHYIVIDWSWRDTKLRRLAEIKEIRKDLFIFITKLAADVIKNEQCKIALM